MLFAIKMLLLKIMDTLREVIIFNSNTLTAIGCHRSFYQDLDILWKEVAHNKDNNFPEEITFVRRSGLLLVL